VIDVTPFVSAEEYKLAVCAGVIDINESSYRTFTCCAVVSLLIEL